jgi:hypothetical protein
MLYYIKREKGEIKMAKVSFTKLGLSKNADVKVVQLTGDVSVEVKQYLPVNDKLILISNVINNAQDNNSFSNPVKLEMFGALEIIYQYTNLSFTEKQKEDPVKIYDLLEGNGIIDKIVAAIPEIEYNAIIDGINDCAQSLYTYRNSIVGLLEVIKADYSDTDFNAKQIAETLSDSDNLTLVKDVLTKLG